MAHKAVHTAVSLYQSGTLTLEEAADLAGVSPGRFRVSLRTQGIEPPAEESAVALAD